MALSADNNKKAWDAIAEYWDQAQGDYGNDMYTKCLVPQVEILATWSSGKTVLDLGSGSGTVCRKFASRGATVIGLDVSESLCEIAETRAKKDGHDIEYQVMDLTDFPAMQKWANAHPEKFDIIVICTTLKSLPDLDPIAEALPLFLKDHGCVVIVDLHPAFSKPAAQRALKIFENPETGKQEVDNHMVVNRYLDIPPSKSEAVRGQPVPVTIYHRPFSRLLKPFFENGLVMDELQEPAFETEGGDPKNPHSYHNYPQIPMLVAIRLKHAKSKLDEDALDECRPCDVEGQLSETQLQGAIAV
ncbi:hypothetical protein LTR86_010390 [Recurvomyces mirabilis]|nr:hypothetical protein LTR86_010390 [Recurvomyces mirabilis]